MLVDAENCQKFTFKNTAQCVVGDFRGHHLAYEIHPKPRLFADSAASASRKYAAPHYAIFSSTGCTTLTTASRRLANLPFLP